MSKFFGRSCSLKELRKKLVDGTISDTEKAFLKSLEDYVAETTLPKDIDDNNIKLTFANIDKDVAAKILYYATLSNLIYVDFHGQEVGEDEKFDKLDERFEESKQKLLKTILDKYIPKSELLQIIAESKPGKQPVTTDEPEIELAYRNGYNQASDLFEQNLLNKLEEK